MSSCATCGAEERPGARFCWQCGAPSVSQCATCGADLVAGDRFCGSCGAALTPGASALGQEPGPSTATRSAHAERRLVSVLFADLVGFTTLSERRDPEEVRELLSQYFDRCRDLIERYGGTVEKFIGDAVMAVWGTPVAREDDAERAVRAALGLTSAVNTLGAEVGMPELRVRAGVLTGSAAVELGAEGEGMVLGDTVNTASRLQSIADPGTVLVDDVTRRASEAAVAYEDAGTHEVKGREEPVRAWRALRVVAGAGGARRGSGLEAPFVARDDELKTVIEAGEASARDGRAKLVAIVGEAGSGKSRLLWEFFKYLDGISEVRWWHQGRCLSYGEGVAYWALAEMVRTRAGIGEEEDPDSARAKLHAAVQTHVHDERERRLVEPRLAHLLRLEERPEADRADLFSGWRLFFERLAHERPVIMAFEDLQWADTGLLEFIDYLLEWSAAFPIFVLALGRPELRERRPRWQPLELRPLEPLAIRQMLDGLVPGLPDELAAEISQRAEGIPLYAVETVRMLQDRGLLVQEGSRYTLTGDVQELEIPETLQALIASRLDGLSPEERTLLQDAAVLGQTFTAAAVAALSDRRESDVTPMLDNLVTKQVLARDDDPRSPERGQYVFIQGLLRTVAYGTLSRRSRKVKHVAAARHLEHTWPGEARDIAEVLAAHYLAAIDAEPDAEDAAALRSSARETLTAAGRAAASLALGSEADHYLSHGAELSVDDVERAALLEQAGRALWKSGDFETAEARLRTAMELHQGAGRVSGGPAAVALATAIATVGRPEEGMALIEKFLATERPEGDDVLRAQALAALANWYTIRGRADEADALFSQALATLERVRELPALAEAMARRAVWLQLSGRAEEALAIARHARELAGQHDATAVALRATFSIAAVLIERDAEVDALPEVNRGLELARERGDRVWERMMMAEVVQCLMFLGRWNEAMGLIPELIAGDQEAAALFTMFEAARVAIARGDSAMLARAVELASANVTGENVDTRVAAWCVVGLDAFGRDEYPSAVEWLEKVVNTSDVAGELGTSAYHLLTEVALLSGDETTIARVLGHLDALAPARITPVRLAQRARLLGEMEHRRGNDAGAVAHEREAIDLLRSVGARPLLADALLDPVRRRGDDEALAEARAIYEELGATRALERVSAMVGAVA